MPIKVAEKSKILFAGIETTEGTAVTLTSANAILTKGLTGTIGEGDVTTDDYDGIDSRDAPESSGNLRNTFSFETPVTFAATAGAVPGNNDILKACGFSPVVTIGTQVIYSPSPVGSLDTVTMEMRRPKNSTLDMVFKTTGARGILGIDMGVGKRPMWKVSNMQGNYIQPVTAAKIANPSYGTQKTNVAQVLNKDTVVKFLLDGKTYCANALTSDNLSGLDISRAETFCGSFTEAETSTPVIKITFLSPDWDALTEANPFLIGRTDDVVRRLSFEVEVGNIAGRKLILNCAEVQPTKPADATIGKSYANTLDLRCLSALSFTLK